MNIRLIASDLDDTLLDEHSRLTERTLRALDAARSLGCRVAFVSGRMVCAMRALMVQAKIDTPAVAYNGGALADPDTFEFLEETPVPLDAAREVLLYCEERNIHAQVYVNDVCYSETLDDVSRNYALAVQLTPGVHVRGAGMKLSRFLTQGSTKMLIIDDPAKVAALTRDLTDRFGGELLFASSRPAYLEITARQANKGNMLRRLAGRLGIPMEEVAAFGDGANDASMLAAAGYGCCVMNAHEKALAACAHRCPSHREDGVAQAIEELIARGAIGGQA